VTPIALDMRTDLARVTYDVLAQPGYGNCTYSSPCAVGAMMTPEQRQALIEINADTDRIAALIDSGRITVPEDQAADFVRLQLAFDRNRGFDAQLTYLKGKYA